jgi:hypothetical protein
MKTQRTGSSTERPGHFELVTDGILRYLGESS